MSESISRSTFLDAAATVVDLVDRIPPGSWDGPGLGEWDLRALVGHTSRSLITVTTYLAQPARTVDVPTAAAYYVAIADALRGGSANAAAVAQRGRDAGAALGDDPAAAFRACRADAEAALAGVADDAVVTTIAGGMRVGDYLPTRTFELAVHGLDVATATGLPVRFTPTVQAEAVTLAARAGVELGQGPVLLAALTGRAPLPPGFSVV